MLHVTCLPNAIYDFHKQAKDMQTLHPQSLDQVEARSNQIQARKFVASLDDEPQACMAVNTAKIY